MDIPAERIDLSLPQPVVKALHWKAGLTVLD